MDGDCGEKHNGRTDETDEQCCERGKNRTGYQGDAHTI